MVHKMVGHTIKTTSIFSKIGCYDESTAVIYSYFRFICPRIFSGEYERKWERNNHCIYIGNNVMFSGNDKSFH